MEEILIRVLQFMLAISLLVLIHEFGHFFFARLFKIRVEQFYLFFNPWFSLFKYKPKNSDTTYGIGWLPLGGYCKIAGMVDESFDTEQLKQPAQPWEFRVKPAWQRLLVMVGGVLMNFLTAMVIYSMILFVWGEEYVSLKDMNQGMKFNTEAKALGFQDGDILLSTNEGELKEFGVDMYRQLSSAKEVTVMRADKETKIALPGELNMLQMIQTSPRFVEALIPAKVDSVLPESPAATAGMVAGDRIVKLNGKTIDSYNDFTFEISKLHDVLAVSTTANDSSAVRQATVVVERPIVNRDSVNGSIIAQNASVAMVEYDTLAVEMTTDLKMGFVVEYPKYQTTKVEYGFFESFPAGVVYGCDVLGGYVDDMKYVFTADGAKSLGGFGTIANLFPVSWDWYLFWKMTAFLSIMLAFMNILPIPALDGGHVVFLLYEMITRRKPSEQFMIRAEYIGFGILVMLLIVANLNDILRGLGYM